MTTANRADRIQDLTTQTPVVVHTWRWRLVSLTIVLLAAVSIGGLVLGVANQAARNAEVQCQAKINSDFQNRIVARNDPNVKDREATDQLFATIDGLIASRNLDPSALSAAFAKYQAQRQVDDQARAAQPLVAPTASACH